jgi:hypothetical protein
LKSPIETLTAAMRTSMELAFNKWSQLYSPIPNPNNPTTILFDDEDDEEFLLAQAEGCVWAIGVDWDSDEAIFELLEPGGYKGVPDGGDTLVGYFVTENPVSPNWDWFGSDKVNITAKIDCEEGCDDDPSCEFCNGLGSQDISML